MSLELLEFGQLRPKPVEGERYQISWSKNGIPAAQYDDRMSFALPIDESVGLWKVTVQLMTNEVRMDLNGVLQDLAMFEIQ